MREIKFRAWDTRERIMSYGRKPYMYLTNTERLIGIGCELHHSMYHDTSRSFEKEIVLMQFTGLKDKNGKEIWEGDIVRRVDYSNNDPRKIGWVYWDGITASWMVQSTPKELAHKTTGPASEPVMCVKEVLGNIYENKELLDALHKQE